MPVTQAIANYIKGKLKAPYVSCDTLGSGAYQVCVSLDAEETWNEGITGYINSRSCTFIVGYTNGNWVYPTVKNYHVKDFDKQSFVTIDDAIAQIQQWIDSQL